MRSRVTLTDTGAPPPHAWEVPTTLGTYVVGARIGVGGMGVVHRATDRRLRRDVALKLIGPMLGSDPHARVRFEREAFTAAGLEHPNVLPIYDAGEDDGVQFLAMRLVAGPSLRRRLATRGVALRDALQIVSQLGSALDAVHDAGICHRDVTPGNVLITAGANGIHAYLTDFGLAAPLGAIPDDPKGGTPGYRAPEHCLGLRCCRQTDVFGLARLADALLAPGATGPIAAVLRRATDPNPLRRPARAGALADELQDVSVADPVAPTGRHSSRRISPRGIAVVPAVERP